MMIAAIQFGSRTIDFRLEYSDRKSLGITVTPEMEVLVKASAINFKRMMNKWKEQLAIWALKFLQLFNFYCNNIFNRTLKITF